MHAASQALPVLLITTFLSKSYFFMFHFLMYILTGLFIANGGERLVQWSELLIIEFKEQGAGRHITSDLESHDTEDHSPGLRVHQVSLFGHK